MAGAIVAGVVRSIVLLRSSEILRSIRESVAPRGVASIDPPACLARSTATPSLSLPLAPLLSRSPSFLPSLRVHTPPTPFPSRVFLFRFEASIPFPRLNRLFVSVSIDTPVSFPSIYAPAFLLSFPRSLHISLLLSSPLPEASSCFLIRVTLSLSLSVFSFLTSVSFSLCSRRRVLCPVHQQLRVSVRIGEALALPPLSFFCSLRLVLGLLLSFASSFRFRFSGFSVPVPRPTTFVFSVTAWRTPTLAAPSSDVR